MAKSVYKPNEIKLKDSSKLTLKLLHDYAPPKVEEEKPENKYDGPTVEELRKEAEAFKVGWQLEKQRLADEAKVEADKIIEDAKKTAFDEVKRQTDQAQIVKADAQTEAQDIISAANNKAAQIIDTAHAEEQAIKDEAYKNAYDSGKDEGIMAGTEEETRLIERIHRILDLVMQRREAILLETEQQIVNLVILMTRKVVKVISDTQKDVVTNNVLAALKKLKTRGDVTIRVNTEDLQLTTDHIKDFINKVEAVQGITVIEDSSIEKGGCVVETDFGAIDARIASQLEELESKILEVSPEKSIEKEVSQGLTTNIASDTVTVE